MSQNETPENVVELNPKQKYHNDPEINALIDVGVRLGIKYVQHIQHIQKMNMAEAKLKEIIKAEKDAEGPEAIKLRKQKMRVGRFLEHGRQKKTPNFGTETNTFVRAVAKWMPSMDKVSIDELLEE